MAINYWVFPVSESLRLFECRFRQDRRFNRFHVDVQNTFTVAKESVFRDDRLSGHFVDLFADGGNSLVTLSQRVRLFFHFNL